MEKKIEAQVALARLARDSQSECVVCCPMALGVHV